MTVGRYPHYRPTGNELVKELPERWSLTKLKYLLQGLGSGGTPSTDNLAFWADDDDGVAWVAIADMSNRSEVNTTAKRVTRIGIENKGLSIWPPGTLIMSMYASLGHAAELKIPAATNQAILALLPKATSDRDFLQYWLQFLQPFLVRQAHSNTQDNLNAEIVRNLVAVTLPLGEQRQIAAFLDYETARIDELVNEQERLQEALLEKRQAVISHAVTKGLNPDASMRNSGVQWLGEVPAHWGVAQSRRLFVERKERAAPQDIQLTVSQKYGLLPQTEYMEREGRRIVTVQRGHDILKRVYAGDFVISMRSFQGGLELAEHHGSMSSAYVPLTPIKLVRPHYFRWLFKSSAYIGALQSTSDLVRDGQAMRFENFAGVPLPVVPESEQDSIAKHLDEVTTHIDELLFQTERSSGLLRERRSALITAAVTGQLDIREWQPPKQAVLEGVV